MWHYKENQGDPPIRPSSLGTAKGLDVYFSTYYLALSFKKMARIELHMKLNLFAHARHIFQ